MWFRFAIYKNAVRFSYCTGAVSGGLTVADIKIRYDVKTPQFAIFGACVICVFYSIVVFVEHLWLEMVKVITFVVTVTIPLRLPAQHDEL